MHLGYSAQGAASVERMRQRGTTLAGQPLWTAKEVKTLRRLYPTMGAVQVAEVLKGRTTLAVQRKVQKLGLPPKRHTWTGAEIVKLRRVYQRGTDAELRAAFPDFSRQHITAIAHHHGFTRPRRPYKITGIPAIDQIRMRAFELGYSMGDVDALARSKRYFRSANWNGGYIHHRAIAKAIVALDGEVAAKWRE